MTTVINENEEYSLGKTNESVNRAINDAKKIIEDYNYEFGFINNLAKGIIEIFKYIYIIPALSEAFVKWTCNIPDDSPEGRKIILLRAAQLKYWQLKKIGADELEPQFMKSFKNFIEPIELDVFEDFSNKIDVLHNCKERSKYICQRTYYGKEWNEAKQELNLMQEKIHNLRFHRLETSNKFWELFISTKYSDELPYELYSDFRDNVNEFYRRQKESILERNRELEEVLIEKQQMVNQAENLLKEQDNYKAIEAYRELYEQYKKLRFVFIHKEVDETLWHKFKAVGNQLFTERDTIRDNKRNIATIKQEFVEDAEKLWEQLQSGSITPYDVMKELKEIRSRYIESGKTFSSIESELWGRLNEATTNIREYVSDFFDKKNADRLEKLNEMKDRIEENISNNEEKLEGDCSESYSDRVQGWIDDDREKLANIEAQIEELEEKMNR